jgi:chaperonin GroEL
MKLLELILYERHLKVLKNSGVIDPVKVGRIALENAASIAGMVLTTACAITEKPEKKAPAPPAGGGYDDMM